MAVDLRILGPITVAVDGEAVQLGPQLRRLLALLAVNAPQVVSADLVADSLWPSESADPTGKAVRTYVARLRNALGENGNRVIRTVAPGYRLEIAAADRIDALEFESAVNGIQRADAVERLAALDEALAAWAGRALEEFADEPWAHLGATRLEEMRVRALEDRYDAALQAGLHASSVADLHRLVAEFPLRDRLTGQLMLALHRSGRQADALRTFQRHREVMADAGLEPSGELRLLDERIASDDPLLGLETEPDRIRGYLRGERLGEGAFSTVWRAVQPTVGRHVAIKQIKAELANRPEYVRAFEREAHLVAALEHPRIVPLYDFWREAGAAYLVMRYLSGGTLADAIPRDGADLGFVAMTAAHVGEALQTAHAADVVHCDVKPANIFLDEAHNAYLGDFGIAVGASDDSVNAVSSGSPAYCSPEQARNEPPSAASDTFSLAVSLYEALTGRLAIDASGLAMAPLPPVSPVRGELPPLVDEVLHRATQPDPTHRFGSVDEFVNAFVGAIGNRAATERPTVATEITSFVGRNPYRGLAAFGEADAPVFFGRAALVDRLLETVRRDARCPVVIVGPSGSGKSSIVRAGLLPAIHRGAIPGSDRWFTTTMMPGVSPYEELEVALSRLETRSHAELDEVLRGDERGIARAVKLTLDTADRELLLVIDQFEELYTLCADADERRRFSTALAAAVTDPRSQLRVVATIRADFWDRPLRDPALAELVESAAHHVVPMSPDELEAAIAEPAARAGCEFDPGLVARISADVSDQPGALPLLQYALTELFEHRDGRRLTRAAYEAMGGVSGAIAQRAESEYAQLPEDARLAARRILGRLVTLGEGTEDTRRRILRKAVASDATSEVVVEQFGTARLLSFDRDHESREPTVEIAHEALLREWPRFRAWLDDDRVDIQIERHIERAARDWHDNDRPETELYRGGRLETALEWSAAHPDALDVTEREFLAAGDAAARSEQERERQRVRRLRTLLAAAAVGLVVALAAVLIANDQRGEADAQRAEAQRQAGIADANSVEAARQAEIAQQNAAEARAQTRRAEENSTEAQRQADNAILAEATAVNARREADLGRLVANATALASSNEDPQLAMLLAAESHARAPEAGTLGALQRALARTDGLLGYLEGEGGYTRDGLVFTDDGRLLARSANHIEIWNLDRRELVRSIEVGDGERLAILDDEAYTLAGGELVEVDLSAGEVIRTFGGSGTISTFDFSAAPSAVAVGYEDGSVEIGGLDDWGGRLALDGAPATLADLEFSPDGRVIVGVDADYRKFRWDVESGEQELLVGLDPNRAVAEHQIGRGQASHIRWLSNELFLVGDFALTDLHGRDGAQLAEFGGVGGFFGLTYLGEGRLVAGDILIRIPLEPAVTGGLTIDNVERRLDGSHGRVVASAAMPGSIVATGSDRSISLWSLDGAQILAEAIPNVGVDVGYVDRAGGRLLSMRWTQGRYVVNDLANGEDVTPDAGSLATIFYEPSGEVVTWDGPPEFATQVLDDETFEPLGARFPFRFWDSFAMSPDQRFAAMRESGVTSVWDLQTGEQILEFASPDGSTRGGMVGFSSDSSLLLSLWGSGVITVWDVESWTEVVEMADVIGSVSHKAATFSRAGHLLATIDSDGVVSFYDTTGWQLDGPVIEGAPDDAVAWPMVDPMRFTEDDRYLLVGGSSGGQLYDVESRRLIGGQFPNLETSLIHWSTPSPSARHVVTGIDGYLLAWNADPDTWLDVACRAAGRPITEAEWAARAGALSYDPVCT